MRKKLLFLAGGGIVASLLLANAGSVQIPYELVGIRDGQVLEGGPHKEWSLEEPEFYPATHNFFINIPVRKPDYQGVLKVVGTMSIVQGDDPDRWVDTNYLDRQISTLQEAFVVGSSFEDETIQKFLQGKSLAEIENLSKADEQILLDLLRKSTGGRDNLKLSSILMTKLEKTYPS